MRVAHFVQRYPPALGGSEAYFARLSRFLAAAGDRVTVFTTTALELEAFWSRRGSCLNAGVCTEEAVEVRRYPLWRWPGRRYLLKALSVYPHRLWQCLMLPCNPVSPAMWSAVGRRGDWNGRDSRPFDLVHATAFPYAWPMVCGLRLARRLGVPFLLTPFLHLGNPDDPHDATRRAYLSPALMTLARAADRIFVQTSAEKAALLEQGIANDKLVLLGMGVEAEGCTGGNRARVRQEWGAKPGEVVVGHLANNSEEKGTVDLLRAAARAWQVGRPFHVVLAGPEMPNFRCFWDRYSYAQQVRRLGILTEQQKRDFFAGIDIFALPSRSDSFGLVLLEAWANGVPNIAYRAGGVAAVVRHELDGLLVRCGDEAGLAEALGHLISDGELRRRLGAAGQERVGIEFQWKDKLDRVRSVYRELVTRDK